MVGQRGGVGGGQHTHHLLVDEVSDEAERRQTELLVIAAESLAELDHEPLDDQLANLRKLQRETGVGNTAKTIRIWYTKLDLFDFNRFI